MTQSHNRAPTGLKAILLATLPGLLTFSGFMYFRYEPPVPSVNPTRIMLESIPKVTHRGIPNALHVFALSSDGKRFLAGDRDGKFRLYDLDSGDLIKEVQFKEHFGSLHFLHPSHSTLLMTWRHGPYLYDLNQEIVTKHYKFQTGFVFRTRISKNGRYLITFDMVNPAQLWDLLFEKPVAKLGTEGAVHVTFSPDGTSVLTVDRENVFRFWETTTGKMSRTFSGIDRSDGQVLSIAFSPSGDKLVIAYSLHMEVWDLRNGRVTASFPYQDSDGGFFEVGFVGMSMSALMGNGSLRVSPNGRFIFFAGSSATYMFDLESGKCLSKFVEGPDGPAVSLANIELTPDGRHLIQSHFNGPLLLFTVPSFQ